MNTKDLVIIKAGLSTTALDKPPLEPYTPMKKAPPKFPYEEHTLLPPDDSRKIIQTKEALDSRAAKIAKIEEKAKEMRVSTEEKIQAFKGTEGYEVILQEMNVFKEKLASEVESTLDRVGKALIEQGDTIMTVYEQTTKGAAGTADVQKALVDAVTKYATPEVAGKIIKAADEAIAAIVEASVKIKRRLASWPSPQDLRKKVKQELPKGASRQVMAAGVVDTIKSFFGDAFQWLKGVLGSVVDKVANLVSAVDQGEPLIEQMKTLLGQTTIGASKKTADYRGSLVIFEDRYAYADAMIAALGEDEILSSLISAMSDDEARANFDHIAQANDLYFTQDGRAISAEEYDEGA